MVTPTPVVTNKTQEGIYFNEYVWVLGVRGHVGMPDVGCVYIYIYSYG